MAHFLGQEAPHHFLNIKAIRLIAFPRELSGEGVRGCFPAPRGLRRGVQAGTHTQHPRKPGLLAASPSHAGGSSRLDSMRVSALTCLVCQVAPMLLHVRLLVSQMVLMERPLDDIQLESPGGARATAQRGPSVTTRTGEARGQTGRWGAA